MVSPCCAFRKDPKRVMAAWIREPEGADKPLTGKRRKFGNLRH